MTRANASFTNRRVAVSATLLAFMAIWGAPDATATVKSASLFAVSRSGGGVRRTHDSRLIATFASGFQNGKVIERPSRPHDGALSLMDVGQQRDFHYWASEGVVAEVPQGAHPAVRRVVGLKSVMAKLSAPQRLMSPRRPEKVQFAHFDYRAGAGERLVQSVGLASRVVYAQVVDVLGSYHVGRPEVKRREQETTYVLRVYEDLKGELPAVPFLRLRWSGGYLEGGQVRENRLLRQGEQLILFLNRNHSHPKRGARGSALDWVISQPAGCMVIRNGRTRMLSEENSEAPAEQHPRYSDGEDLFGKPVDQVLERLRFVVRWWKRNGGAEQGEPPPPD